MKNMPTIKKIISYIMSNIESFNNSYQTIIKNRNLLQNITDPQKSELFSEESFDLLIAVDHMFESIGRWIVMGLDPELLISRANRNIIMEVAHQTCWGMENMAYFYKNLMLKFFQMLDQDLQEDIKLLWGETVEQHDDRESTPPVFFLSDRSSWEFILIALEYFNAHPTKVPEIQEIFNTFDAELKKRPGALINFNDIRSHSQDFILKHQERFPFMLEDSDIEPFLLEEATLIIDSAKAADNILAQIGKTLFP